MTEPDTGGTPGVGEGGPSLAALLVELRPDLDPAELRPETLLRTLGLESIMAARLWLDLQDEFGVDVGLTWLVEKATIGEIEDLIAGGERVGGGLGLSSDPDHRYDPFPLTPLQQSYLLGTLDDLTDDPVGCHLYEEFEVPQGDPVRLRAAWERLVERHDALRLVVSPSGQQQVLDRLPAWEIVEHDLVAADEAETAEHRADVRRRLSHQRYAAGSAPLFTVELTRGRDRVVVHLSIDALVADGHSVSQLLDEWAALYHDPAAELPDPGPTVRDAIVSLHQRSGTAAHERDRAYWRAALDDLPALPDWAQPVQDGSRRRRPLSARLEQPVWNAIRARAESVGVSPTSLVLSAYAGALGDSSDSGDGPPVPIVVTTSERVRLGEAAGALIAPLTSTAVLAVPVDGTADELAPAVHRQVLEAVEHGSVSAVEALRELRGRGRMVSALPFVLTSMLGQAEPTGTFARDRVFGVSQTSDVLIDHQIWEADGALHIRWDSAVGRMPPAAAENAFARFLTALNRLAVPPGAPERQPLNPLQQAYYVARVEGPQGRVRGCQIYKAVEVEDLDVGRLAVALRALLQDRPAMRSFLGADGMLHMLAAAPAGWVIPVIDLSGVIDVSATHAAIRDDMCRPVRPGRGPAFDVRVTHTGRAWTVHCAVDLAVFDAPSAHLVIRDLIRRAAGVSDLEPAVQPAVHPAGAGDRLTRLEASAYWDRRIGELPAGPELDLAAAESQRRLAGRITGWQRLVEHADRLGLSPDTLLLAAFGEALTAHGIGGPEPYAVPVVRWNEPGAEVAENTALSWVPIAARGSPAEAARSFQDLLDADRAADAVAGLAVLRRRAMRERSGGGFAGAYPIVYTSVIDLTGAPLPASAREVDWLSATPDVALDAITVADGDTLEFCWDVRPEVFSPGAVQAAFTQWGRSIAALISGAEADVPKRGRLSRDDWHRQLYAWNDTPAEFPADRLAHHLVEDRAADQPDAIAVHSRSGNLTFRELNAEANRIAWQLIGSGAGPGSVVAISVRRGPSMVAAALGVLKAGAAYLPVEPSLPAERAEMMLTQSGSTVVLTTSATSRWPDPAGCTVVRIDRDLPRGPEDGASRNPEPRAAADDLAYIIFTSGSTGAPKGVAVAHRAVSNLLAWGHRRFGFGPDDLGLSVTSLGFDLSVFDLVGLLGYGAGIYVVDEEQQRDPALLASLLLTEPVTFWNSAPTSLAQVAPLLPGAEAGRPLRLVFLSGDYTPLSLPDELWATFPEAELISLGGATEATIWSNYFPVEAVDLEWRSIPYGRPLANSRYYVLDEELAPCPPGQEGDLYIAGDCLSQGYYAAAELTADRFVVDPFGLPGERMYRTGDRATYFPDGVLCFCGRRDGQVKIRGFRVELGEIEHRLLQHPAVKDAVVVARPDNTGDRRLVAYLVAAGDERPSPAELREYAAEALPDYMVPNVTCWLATFPATANGKLDRDALPWPVKQESEPEPTDDPRRSGPDAAELAEEIAGIFGQVLGETRFEAEGDIWDQGATSFTVVQVSGELQQRYGHRIPISAVLERSTAAGIAAHLHGMLSGDEPPSEAPEPAAPAELPEPVATPDPVTAESVAGGTDSDDVDFFSAQDRVAFKAGQRHLRPLDDAGRLIPLAAGDDDAAAACRSRASRRDFRPGGVPVARLAELLGLLGEVPVDDRTGRRFPSAGDTYAVQVYVRVKPGGVDGLDAGSYYYRPGEHVLQPVGDGVAPARNDHFYYNRPIFDSAAFELLLVGQTAAIAPLYGDNAERYLAIEAGHMGQLLMEHQSRLGVGLCPIGEIAIEPLEASCDLDPGHRLLVAYCGGAIEPDGTEATAPAQRSGPDAAVAIVGMACRYPGADDPEAFWTNLVEGRRSVGSVPAERTGQTGDQPVGHLGSISEFDSLAFHVSPHDAATLDPQVRLLLETVWHTLEYAGHTPTSLRRESPRVGVFVASMWQDYAQAGAEAWRAGRPAQGSATASDLPNRVSHFFDFDGPSIAVDTSCSSSLTALHLATTSLRAGECDAAIVAGVNVLAHRYHAELLAEWGLSAQEVPAGAFDADSAGWIPGEGVGALLLRRLADTRHDTVHAVVDATAVGHVGHAGRFGVPDVSRLARSIEDVIERAGLGPDDIGYVECAAAGAPVPDSSEIEALARVFDGRSSARPLPVGTVKPNIGHLEAASGLSQLTKVILQLRHRTISPTLLSPRPTPMLPWNHLPIEVVPEVREWRGPRRALVNAVGAAGSYGHAVLRAAPEPTAPAPPAGEQTGEAEVVALSAATPEQLRELAARYVGFLPGYRGRLGDVAFTSREGRIHQRHRLAVVCSNLDDVAARLADFLAGRPHPDVKIGEAPPSVAEHPPAPGERAATAREWAGGWVSGEAVRRPEAEARRVPLPAYPFARDRHWLATAPAEVAGPVVKPERRAAWASGAAGDDRLDRLCGLYARESGIAVSRLDPDVSLERYGLTSALVMTLVAELQREFGDVSPTLFYEHATLASVAANLPRPNPGGSVTGPPACAVPAEPAGDDIAIIGLAGRYPGAEDLASFWRLLERGEDRVGRIPAHRTRPGWPTELMWGSFLDRVDTFDPLFFGITPRDSDVMDPQERLFIEVVWEALEDAGHTRRLLRQRYGANVGVFAATMYNDYPFFGVEQSLHGAPVSTGSSPAGIANRISYHLDLSGPSMVVDTMCSASLTALHLAVTSLRTGECGLAIAGGVNLSLHPNKFIEQTQLQMTASDHRCRAFGAGGDGFVPGEGVGAVLLKPLAAAEADEDRIHAVIKATAVNHGGRSNGYHVPEPGAQGAVVGRALARADVDPASLGYIEAHGTGTALGDPIEIEGLRRAFGSDTAAGACAIGSVKSNIGHLEGAAGIAGLTKVVLQLRHRRLVPTLHAAEPNPEIDWDRSPLRLQHVSEDWPEQPGGGPRRAGVSAFGAGGTNAHVVLEEYRRPARIGPAPTHPQVIVLSARDADRLRESAARLADHVSAAPSTSIPMASLLAETRRSDDGDVISRERLLDLLTRHTAAAGSAEPPADLDDIAFTLQTGREAMRERMAVVVADRAELVAALRAVAAGETVRGVFRGRAPARLDDAEPTDQPTEPAELAARWVQGEPVDWMRLHAGCAPRMVGLPAYPFARQRHWLPDATVPPLYRVTWSPAATPPASRPERGDLLCVHDDATASVARAFAASATGGRVILCTPADLAGWTEQIRTRTWQPAGLVDLADLDRSGPDAADWRERLALVTALAATVPSDGPAPRIMHVVRGLHEPGGAPPSLAGARLAGFVRALPAERPRVRVTVLDTDLPADRPDEVADQIRAEWAANAREVCYRDGRRMLPDVSRVIAPSGTDPELDPRRVYLVTGGTSGIGADVARHLVRRGARRIGLLGLRPVADRSTIAADALTPHETAVHRLLDELEVSGVQADLYTGRLTDTAALSAYLDRLRAELGPIAGIVHCAGQLPQVAPLTSRSSDQIDAVLEPKVDGLLTLDRLCRPDRPDFMVLFSSLASTVASLSAGVLDYAAANAFLEYVATHEGARDRGMVRAVAWPSWRGSGTPGIDDEIGRSAGLASISVDEVLRVLDSAIGGGLPPVVLVAPPADGGFDPQVLVGRAPAVAPVDAAEPEQLRLADQAPPVVAGTGDLPAWLVGIFADALGVPAAEIESDIPFADLGVESVLLGELVRRIEAHLGRPVEPSLLLEHSTLVALAAHLGSTASAPLPVDVDVEPTPPPAIEAPVHPIRAAARMAGDERRIAVIGAAGRFPGAADLAAFWTLLQTGACAVTEVPASRWDTAALYRSRPEPGFSISTWGGFVDGIEDFDPDYFGLTEDEATCLDPAIRLVLEGTVNCLADAGYREGELDGAAVGVFVGARQSDYRQRVGIRVGAAGFGADQNFIAARVAQHLNLTGPNLVVDSACSSALVAVQLAMRSLLAGESDLALAAAADVLLDERPYLEFSAVQALSPTGRCRTFDRDADGFVPGEGAGVLLLKRLDRALADGDRIHAVIDSVAVGNDGRTMGLTTPNPQAQAAVVRAAMQEGGRSPDEIGMLEAHGTGTMIGDPIEVRALTDVYAEHTARTGYCAIGSVKSNVGHLLSAAGMAGLIKVILALEHGEIPPTLHCDVPNPRFDFTSSPFVPQQSLTAWPAGPRVAGVSAFGLGGTNAHVIVSAAPDGHAAARTPLAAPQFRRRRLWLDRPAPEPAPGPDDALIASLLEFEIVPDPDEVLR